MKQLGRRRHRRDGGGLADQRGRPARAHRGAAAVASPRRRRRIVSISSDAAVNHYETWGLYGAGKAALDHVTLTFGAETGVAAYAVDPGDMRTQMHQDAFPGEDISDRPLPETVVPVSCACSTPVPSPAATGRVTSDDDAERIARHRTSTPRSSRRGRRRSAAWPGTRCVSWSVRANGIAHARFRDLPEHLRAGDVLVVNNSATVQRRDRRDPARQPTWCSTSRPASRAATGWSSCARRPDAARAVLDAWPGDVVRVGDVSVTLAEPWPDRASPPRRPGRATGCGEPVSRGDLDAALERDGRPIAYGYLDRRYPLDRLPDGLRHAARQRRDGVGGATVHRGTGDAAGRPRHRVRAGHAAHRLLLAGGRRGAGTGVVRGARGERSGDQRCASRWWSGDRRRHDGDARDRVGGPRRRVVPQGGWTERVITPAAPPEIVDGLITGWHDPHASHLLLVEAVAGRTLTQAAYDEAVANGYLWHEFGDSALLLP